MTIHKDITKRIEWFNELWLEVLAYFPQREIAEVVFERIVKEEK